MTGILQRAVPLLLLAFAACSSSPGKDHRKELPPAPPAIRYEAGKVYENQACRSDAAVTYAIYFPSSYKEGEKLPLFLAFDPDASGLLPVTKYKDLADKYRFILMGSNTSKNNQSNDETDRIVGNLREEIATQLPVDPDQLYLTGFSGGSRIASLICMFQQGIRGMIGCGAGFAQVQQPPRYNFDYFGIVGDGDFNLQEMIQLDQRLEEIHARHYLLIYKGKHQWAPASMMELGFIWHLRGGITPAFTDALAKVKETEPVYTQEMFGKEIRDQELARQQEFLDAFLIRDLDWWKHTLARLRKTKGIAHEEVAMNQRLLAYLSLVCYSHSKRALSTGDKKGATYSITLYGMVDPDNPEVGRMKAELAKMP
ncbi:MAG TPA: hypothetical protein VMC08_04200 [Bacteroidales bacterium]|nr:hypothetical protein [Bacteroidales bacterium]